MHNDSVNITPRATLVVPTKNRKDELRRALLSVRRQTIPLDVFVMDDGSTDGTPEMVAREFPEVTIRSATASRGPTAQRNLGTSLARTPIVVSIDDDCVLENPDTLEKTLSVFDNERVGLVSIPYIDALNSGDMQGHAPDSATPYAAFSFRACSYAVRKDAFLKAGGYRELLTIQGEEDDLSIRLLDHGYLVIAGDAPPIYHYESPRRDWSRLDILGARNTILFTWLNVPLVALPVHMAATTWNLLAWGFKVGRPKNRTRGVLRGFRDMIAFRQQRAPVQTSTYRLFRRLKKGGPLPVAAIGNFGRAT